MVLDRSNSTLTPPTAANFATVAGVNTAAAARITVSSNATYTITAAAASATFSGGSNSKPSSTLKYTTDGFTSLKAVTGAGSALVMTAAVTASAVYTIGYNTTYAWLQDTPGTYTLAINYTLTAP